MDMDRVLEVVRRQAKEREKERERESERGAMGERSEKEWGGGSKTQGCVPAGNHASG